MTIRRRILGSNAKPTPTGWWLAAILIVAAALRLGYVLSQDFDAYYVEGGGDTVWYLENGYTLVTGENPTGKHDVSTLSTAPLFLVFVGVWQAILSPHAAIIAILISQAFMGVAIVYFSFGVGHHLAHDPRIGLIAAGILAISPQFVLEAANVLTESLFIFLLMAGLWLYATRIMKQSGTPSLILSSVLTGIAFGSGDADPRRLSTVSAGSRAAPVFHPPRALDAAGAGPVGRLRSDHLHLDGLQSRQVGPAGDWRRRILGLSLPGSDSQSVPQRTR